MDTIIYNGATFNSENAAIMSGKCKLGNSMIMDTLEYDTFTFIINNKTISEDALYSLTDALSSITDDLYSLAPASPVLIPYVPGKAVEYYHDGVLKGKFYLDNITRVSTDHYQFTCVSAIGLLDNISFNGGMYNGVESGDTVGTLISSILSPLGITYSVEQTLSATAVYGWLPICTSREALQQILFAYGASVMKDSSGNLAIKYNQPDEARLIDGSKFSLTGGGIDYTATATKVTLIEHSFYAGSGDSVVLYNNTSSVSDAVNEKIIFSSPVIVSSLAVTGTLTISNQTVNSVVVNGKGSLTGIYYTHIQRELVKDNLRTGTPREQSVTDATLVNSLNSTNCLERIASYLTTANEVSWSMWVDDEKPGELISFTDPFGDPCTGLIKTLDMTLSGILKGDITITKDWLPNHLGNNYTAYKLITPADWGDENQIVAGQGTHTVNIPVEMQGKPCQVVMFGGSSGGNGSYAGGNGEAGDYGYYSDPSTGYTLRDFKEGAGGVGGNGGDGGAVGKVLKFDIASLASSYSVTLGSGGAGGAIADDGAEGTATSMVVGGETKTTVNDFAGNYTNLINGDIYAKNGDDGLKGGDGGSNGHAYTSAQDGESVTDNGITYTGGLMAEGVKYSSSGEGWRLRNYSCATSGGGAAWGTGGGNATSPVDASHYGYGGNGVQATVRPKAIFGNGGHGADGGGGGGGGGCFVETYKETGEDETWSRTRGLTTTGGAGQVGGEGSDGFILIYYNPN